MDVVKLDRLESLLYDAFKVPKAERSTCKEVKEVGETHPLLAEKICDICIDDEELKKFVYIMIDKLRSVTRDKATIESATKDVSSILIGKYHPEVEKYRKSQEDDDDQSNGSKRKRT